MHTSTRRAATSAAAALACFAVTGYAMAASGPPAAAGRPAAARGQVTAKARIRPAAAAQPAKSAAALPGGTAGPSRPASHDHAIRPATAAAHGADSRRPARTPAVPRREVGGRLLSSSGIVVAPHARPLPRVPASAYVIADARTGQVLAAKDPHGRYPPASTLKVLTAITMLPRLRPGGWITASALAASMQPNIIGLIPGHRYRVADLFRALLLISANDAAVSLVQASGSFAHGMALVNAEAQHLQAYDIVAKMPNGLPAPGQVVSAYDLALIARRALGIPAFMRYDRTLSATFTGTRFGPVHMVNENGLLTQYAGGLGGKIGWTAAAGATYVGMARRHGVTLIVSILHATPLTEIASAESLLNWGFAARGHVRPVGTLVRPLARR